MCYLEQVFVIPIGFVSSVDGEARLPHRQVQLVAVEHATSDEIQRTHCRVDSHGLPVNHCPPDLEL